MDTVMTAPQSVEGAFASNQTLEDIGARLTDALKQTLTNMANEFGLGELVQNGLNNTQKNLFGNLAQYQSGGVSAPGSNSPTVTTQLGKWS